MLLLFAGPLLSQTMLLADCCDRDTDGVRSSSGRKMLLPLPLPTAVGDPSPWLVSDGEASDGKPLLTKPPAWSWAMCSSTR